MKKYLAELIGTFVLTFFGCGTAVVTNCGTDNYPGYLLTALAFGLAIVAMAYSIGNISGCHVNPAVSLAMYISGKMNVVDLAGYVVAQCCGGLIAGFSLMTIFGKGSGLGANGLYNGNIWASILVEIILTCVFVLTILGVTSKKEFTAVAGIVIGLSLTFVHILGIGLTGTSVNPARSLVAVFAGGEALRCYWVFLAGPAIGACLATVIHGLLLTEDTEAVKAVSVVPAEPEKTEEPENTEDTEETEEPEKADETAVPEETEGTGAEAEAGSKEDPAEE